MFFVHEAETVEELGQIKEMVNLEVDVAEDRMREVLLFLCSGKAEFSTNSVTVTVFVVLCFSR